MGNPAYSNIYDPVAVRALIGDKWLKEARIVTSGVAELDSSPIAEGTLVYGLRERIVQDVSGQTVAAGGTIATSAKTQTLTKHPRLWRYGSITEADVLTEIESKGITSDDNAGMANSIQNASMQYVDDALVNTIIGSGAALSANNTGSGSTITLALLITAMAARGERGTGYNGGAFAVNSAIYWKLVSLGVIAATSNTFGNVVQDKVVQTGALPTQLLGMTPIISDKFAVFSSTHYYMYLIEPGALTLRAAGAPVVKSSRPEREFSTVTDFKTSFGIGFKGLTFVGTASEVISDTDLATAANWNVSYTAENAVGLGRFWTAT